MLNELAGEVERLEEALLSRNLTQLNEPGWQALGSGSIGDEVANAIDRHEANRAARWYYHQDPTAQQVVRLHNAYTFGRGVDYDAQNEAVQTWLDRFWRSPRNRQSLTRAKAQWRLNTERQLDGELFFALYVSTATGAVTVRVMDPSEFWDENAVITMPGDPTWPVYYRRSYLLPGATSQRQTALYPDYRNAAVLPGVPGNHTQNGRAVVTWPAHTEIYMYHVCTNPLGGRGLTHLNAGIPWIKALKGFMEDRATLTTALATFAFKQKIKGNRQALQRVIDQWGTYETQYRYGLAGDTRERRQGANTWIENQASDLEQLKTDSGSSNAYNDMKMFRQMAAIGAGGISEHYMGDPSTGNLATATAMELPMLKMFEYEQQLWQDIFGEILNFVIIQGVRFNPRLRPLATVGWEMSGGSPVWTLEPQGGADLTVDVTMPPIVLRDIAVHAAALASIAQVETMTGQQTLPPEVKAKIALDLHNIDDAGQIIDEMRANGFKIDSAATSKADGGGATAAPSDAPETLASTIGLNGAQIDAAMRVLLGVQQGTMAPSVAVALLTSLGIDEKRAQSMVNDTLAQPAPAADGPPPDTTEARLIAAIRAKYRQAKALRAAASEDDDPPDVGKALAKDDAEQVDPVTKSELDQAFEDWSALPELDDLLDELGMTLDDVED